MRIVTFKTAYYSFYLPVACGMLIAGIDEPAAFQTAKEILLIMGQYFQAWFHSAPISAAAPHNMKDTQLLCPLSNTVTICCRSQRKRKNMFCHPQLTPCAVQSLQQQQRVTNSIAWIAAWTVAQVASKPLLATCGCWVKL